MTKKIIVSITLLLSCISMLLCKLQYTQLEPYPGKSMMHCQYFVIGNCIYVNGGDHISPSDNNISTELWEYNTSNNKWTKKANYPSKGRKGGVGFSINGLGYVVLGGNIGKANFTSCWEYNPQSNKWTQKANFPGKPRINSTSFIVEDKAIIVGGYDQNSKTDQGYLNDVWEFNPSINLWQQKKDFPGEKRWGAVSFKYGNTPYYGLGQNCLLHLISKHDNGEKTSTNSFYYSTDIWSYDIKTDTWNKECKYTNLESSHNIGFILNNKIYMTSGINANNKDDFLTWFSRIIYEFDLVNSEFNRADVYPSKNYVSKDGWESYSIKNCVPTYNNRGYEVGIVVNGKFYYGLGCNIQEQFNDFWVIEDIN